MDFSVIKLQLAEMCFILLIIINFYRDKSLKVLTTQLFSWLLTVVVLFLDLDIIASVLFTNAYEGVVLEWMFKFSFLLLLTCVFLLSAYVEFSANATVVMTGKILATVPFWVLPYIVCLFGTVLGDITVYQDYRGLFFSGSSMMFLYAGVIFYTVLNFVESLRYSRILTSVQQKTVYTQTIIWMVLIMVQTSENIFLLGLAASLNIMLIYFTFENPSFFIDEKLDMFNTEAFDTLFFSECNCIGKKPFYLAVLVIEDHDMLLSSLGGEGVKIIRKEMGSRIYSSTKKDPFIISETAFGMFFRCSREELIEKGTHLEKIMSAGFQISGTMTQVMTHLLVFDCPSCVRNPELLKEYVQIDFKDTGEYIRFASEEMKVKKERETKLIEILRNAIADDGFDVYFQPIYSTEEKTSYCSEALIRLKDTETLGYISPEEFIPLAEKNGFVVQIGEIVFKKVCDAINHIRRQGIRLDYVEVNLSTLQLINDAVTNRFIDIMRVKNIEPSSINLEVTETAAISSAKLLEKNMRVFRQAGCSFSMDDFGTGYSNLSAMTDISYDIVKLDKSLIWPAFKGNEKAMKMLVNIIRMLKNLDLRIVAEGVETEEMAQFLMENGVDYLQGFLYSRPVPVDKYIEYLQA